MNDAQLQTLDYKVSQWLYKNPTATKLPGHIESMLLQLQRHQKANRNKLPATQENKYKKDYIEEILSDYGKRKELEIALADYVSGISTDQFDTYKLEFKLRECRREGVFGTIDGRHVKRFDCKCGNSKLCPHEGRQEQRRVFEKYYPAFLNWFNEKPTHRIFSTVFTIPNVPLGELAAAQKKLFARVKYWSEKFPQVKGYLASIESPLSNHNDWNVHCNIILLVDGEFNYEIAQEAWGHRVSFREILRRKVKAPNGEPCELEQAIEHCVKYAVENIVSKSSRKGGAPAVDQWPHECFIEWFMAQKGFRRTRSYGRLNKQCKDHLLGDTDDTSPLDTEPEWIAEFKFFEGEGYLVSSLLADKSGKKYRRISDLFYDFDTYNQPQGPP